MNSSEDADPALVVTCPCLSELVKTPGQDVVIPAGKTYSIDDQIPDIGLLQIQGTLKCPTNGSVKLRAQGIQIYGPEARLECGTPARRFPGKLKIEIYGERVIMGGVRTLAVFNQGTLQLVGRTKNSKWLRLAQTARKGDTRLTLSQASDWSAGDRVAIAPTGLDPLEAEDIEIAAVSSDGHIIELKEPLRHTHWGTVQTFRGSRTWTVDQSAEVANLTRSIKIEAPEPADRLGGIGAHVMVMATAKAFIDGVEFTRMGHMGVIARYPFHWHRAGDVTGQYILNSSIHHSFHRCVTVHGTNKALVRNNVCYDHYGHGFFLEDGNEEQNVFDQNLGILTRRPPAGKQVLQSDIDVGLFNRWAGPATFWSVNPNNTFTNNVAAGSEGSGFWHAYVNQVSCNSSSCETVTDGSGNVFPTKAPFGPFDNNRAHSVLVGLAWDGAAQGNLTGNPRNPNDRAVVEVNYFPPSEPILRNNSVTHASVTALYRSGGSFTFEGGYFADNHVSLWSDNQKYKNMAIIGNTANWSDSNYDFIVSTYAKMGYAATRPALRLFAGIWIYDGFWQASGIDFLNFPTAPVARQNVDMTPVPFRAIGAIARYVNTTEKLTFSPEPWRRILLAPDNWLDSAVSIALHDRDGSLSGVADSYVTADHPWARRPECTTIKGAHALACSYRTGLLFFGVLNFPFQLSRSDLAATPWIGDIAPDTLFNKANLILDNKLEYTLRFGKDVSGSVTQFLFQARDIGTLSPLVRFAGVGRGCSLDGVPAVGSLSAVRTSTTPVIFASGEDLYARLRTNTAVALAPSLMSEGSYFLRCTGAPQVRSLTHPLVFESGYYRDQNRDLASFTEEQAEAHFITYGAAEGRRPSLMFDAAEYLKLNPDVANVYGATNYKEAALHYMTWGYSEKRLARAALDPRVFDADYYRRANPELAALSVPEVRDHWLSLGIHMGLTASPNFSVTQWLNSRPDVAAAVNRNYELAILRYVMETRP